MNKLMRLLAKLGKLASILWTLALIAIHIAVIIFGIKYDVLVLSAIAGFSLFYGLVRIGHAAYLLESIKDKDNKDGK